MSTGRQRSACDLMVAATAAAADRILLAAARPACHASLHARGPLHRAAVEPRRAGNRILADAVTDHGVGQIGLWLKDVGEVRASIGYWVVRRHPTAGGQ
jgi:hypothetical protein